MYNRLLYKTVIITFSIFTLILLGNVCVNSHETFNIGGIFEQIIDNGPSKTMEEIMFSLAANYNLDDKCSSNLTLIAKTKYILPHDSILAQQIVCDLLDNSVIAIFGPQSKETASIVKSISDTKEIPHIQSRYDSKQYRSLCGINLYPHSSSLSKAYADVIKKWEWKNFVIVYENNEDLIRISDLLKPELNGEAGIKIFQLPDSGNFRDVFRKIRSDGETKILLDCSIEKLPEVLKQAQQTGLMIENYHYIITCLDLHTINLEQYKYSGVNITGFRLVNPSRFYTKDIVDRLRLYRPELNAELILVEAALLFDAVLLLKQTVSEFRCKPYEIDDDTMIENGKFLASYDIPNCYDEKSWKSGFSIVNLMKVSTIIGLTGLVKFDYEGYRTNIELQIIELTEDGIREKGRWNTTEGVTIDKFEIKSNYTIQDFRNTTFKVIIPMTKPFGMQKRSPSKLEGNERYEGYAVDLLHQLSLLSNFKYEILVEEHGVNGQLHELPNGTTYWDGMMGALLTRQADIAIGDLTMSKDRAAAVEFTTPFMDLGIGILYMKPVKEAPDLFSFLFPFSDVVWLLVITAYIGMSLQFYVMARISPYEWRNPYPCIQEPEELENQFTLSNAFWFTIGSLMQQGSDIAPISPSTRMAAGIWWFFTLVMISSYTANLAAFLTVENEKSPFNNAYELSKQTQITYGAKVTGTTFQYFKDSRIPEYQQIYKFMCEHPEYLTQDNQQGVDRVVEKKGGYAFFMESSSIEYEKEQHCELAQIGPLLDSKNYGIAMRKNTWYADTISKDVLILQEKGVLSSLKRKWWKEKYSKNCQENKQNDAETLTLDNVGGVFLVLIAGVGISFLVMLFELLMNLRNSAKEEKVPLRKQLAKEIKFIMKCKSVKPSLKPDETSLLGTGSHKDTNGDNSESANGNNYDIRHRLKTLYSNES